MKNTKTNRCRRPSKRIVAVLSLVLIVVACASWWLYDLYSRPIRKFRVIIPRTLYQSGQPAPVGLKRCTQEYKIRVILYTRGHLEEWEKPLAKEMGVKLIHFPIDVEHISDRELSDLCKIFADYNNYPMLVHCHAGRSRSSLIVAVHRIKFQNWPVRSAMEEMVANGFPEDRYFSTLQNLKANLPSNDYEVSK